MLRIGAQNGTQDHPGSGHAGHISGFDRGVMSGRVPGGRCTVAGWCRAGYSRQPRDAQNAQNRHFAQNRQNDQNVTFAAFWPFCHFCSTWTCQTRARDVFYATFRPAGSPEPVFYATFRAREACQEAPNSRETLGDHAELDTASGYRACHQSPSPGACNRPIPSEGQESEELHSRARRDESGNRARTPIKEPS